MRQSQKNNRARGRGRKPSNPLSRSYDSNGPDVKIRGTASHIADKYSTLARDALASGDIVMAENYYQHAEHYLRIIAAATVTNRDENRSPAGNNEGARDEPRGTNERGTNNRRNNGAAVEVTGDEPQPEIPNTAVELEVAEVEAPSVESEPAAAAEASEEKTGEEEAPAPRRRRRTTYRSRKRTTSDGDGETKAAPADPASAPQPVVAED